MSGREIERLAAGLGASLLVGLIVWAGLVGLKHHMAVRGLSTTPWDATDTAAALGVSTRPPRATSTIAPMLTLASATPDRARVALGRLCTPDELAQDRAAIAIIEEARGIHQQWITYLEQNPGTPLPHTGDIAWQQDWVRKYEQVLTPLHAELDACAAGDLTGR